MSDIHSFISRHGVKLTCKRTDRNPHMAESHDMDHWRCRLRCGRRSMSLTFSMGSGHHGKTPEVADVLDSLAMEARGCEGNDFESWAGDFGYDLDSRKAHKTFNACKKQTASLKRLMGSAYEELLQCEGL